MLLKYKLRSKTEQDRCRKLLEIANIVYDWSLTPQQMDILVYYIRFGYSSTTMKMILDDNIVKAKTSLYTQNYELGQKGLLEENGGNFHSKDLTNEALLIKEFLEKKLKGLFVEVVL